MSDATPRQKREITKVCTYLGISEPVEEQTMTSVDAGRMIRQLYKQLKLKRGSVRRIPGSSLY